MNNIPAKTIYWIIGLSAVIGILRFFVPGVHHVVSWEDSYEAVAHLWVGYLLALIVINWKDRAIRNVGLWSLGIINAIELTLFFVRK
jgi:hypothetical protein